MDGDLRLLMNPDLRSAVKDTDILDAQTKVAEYGGEAEGEFEVSEADDVAVSEASHGLSAGSQSGSSRTGTAVSASSSRKSSLRGRGRVFRQPPKKSVSPLTEKHDLVFKMNRMMTRGGKQSRPMSAEDPLEELRAECARMERELDTERSVKFQQSLLTSFATGVECLSSKFGVGKLDGWSDSIKNDLSSYDEVFEELHAKYGVKSSMPPELKLLGMVAGSAVMFHLSGSVFRSCGAELDEVMRDDPELAKTVAAAVARKAAQKESSGPANRGMAGLFAGLMSGGLAAKGPPPGAPISGPGDTDSVAGVERLFSDTGSESESNAAPSVESTTRGLILDA